MREKTIFDVDSYKLSHYLQQVPGTVTQNSYVSARGGKYTHVCSVGLQALLDHGFSDPVTMEDVEKADPFYNLHGEPFNRSGWEHVVHEHGGFFPLRIRALPEGTFAPVQTALVTVENTCKECAWATSWAETALLRVWYPTTVATLSASIKKLIKGWLDKTSDDPEGEIPFKLHDFGSRGVSSQESAALGGMAHLVSFMGSDTVAGVRLANNCYGHKMSGFSIPASEHSTVTAWGRENEVEAYRNMLKHFGKAGAVFACVSDSYDIHNACLNLWGDKLREDVIKSGAVVVVRPDSGNPPDVVVECLKNLDSRFGHVVNKKGYKVLNHVRVIQGDGITYDTIRAIILAVVQEGYSVTNVAFGMGGALLQQVNRDTCSFAMKCSNINVNGQNFDVFKDPVTDSGKRSLKGRLDTVLEDGKLVTKKLPDNLQSFPNTAMETVWENGVFLKRYNFDEVRENAAKTCPKESILAKK